MLKKFAALLIGVACLIVPFLSVGTAAAKTPSMTHRITIVATQHVFWDRNWPSSNRELSKNYDYQEYFSSTDTGGVTARFRTTTSFNGLYDLDGVRVEAFIKVKEIPNSGGKVTASFTNELSYGYGGSDSWDNHTACSFQMVPNGVYRYTLLNKSSTGSWGKTDIKITHAVS